MNKKISDIEIYEGEITEYVKNNYIDAVVNAANPTLMGSFAISELHRSIFGNSCIILIIMEC